MTEYPRRTNDRTGASGNPVSHERFPTNSGGVAALRLTSVIALLAVIAGFVIRQRPVSAQAPPVAFELLAAAFSPARRISIRTKGPSDILQTKIVVQPGGDTGWHTHPGPVIVVVKSGTVTEHHENGCVSIHHEGSVFFEAEDEVHRVVNEGSVPIETYATFLIPHGSEPLMPALDPGSVCNPHHGRHHDRDRDKTRE